jgi:Nucleotidyl transferase AbiEii toxin, Type IV TA system
MLNEDYKEMLQSLLDQKAEFIVVGAYALAAHGFPRATGDIDIWIKPDEKNSKKVYKALASFGAPINEIREDEFSQPGLIFQIGVVPRRIDIITKIDAVEFEEADTDKIFVNIDDLKIPVLSIDKLIKNKMATGREKDLLDAKLLKKRMI